MLIKRYMFSLYLCLFAVIATLAFSPTEHEAKVFLWCALSLLIAYLIIASTYFNVTSFVSIFVFGTIIYFPVAGLFNLAITEPAIDPFLWSNADRAQYICFVGLSGLLCAVVFLKSSFKNISANYSSMVSSVLSLSLPTKKYNFIFVLLFIPSAGLALILGVYYHGSLGVFNFENQIFINLLRWIKVLAYLGVFYQLARWVRYKSTTEFLYFVTFIAIAILVYLPSGNKTATIGFIPLLCLTYFHWEKETGKKVVYISLLIGLMLAVILVGQIFRSSNITGGASYSVGLQRVISTVRASERNLSDAENLNAFVARISDFRVVGHVVAQTPNYIPFRYFEDIDLWWQIFIPGFLRPSGRQINFQDGAFQVVRYGIYGGGSSPLMLFGDFYSRFGCIGVFSLTFLLGLLLIKLDASFRNKSDFFRLTFFLLYAGLIFNLSTATLVVVFVTFTRDLVIVFLISKLLDDLLPKESYQRI